MCENGKWLICPRKVGKALQAEKQHEQITRDRWFVLHRTQRCREILGEDPSWCPLHISVLARFSGRLSTVTNKQFQSHVGDSCCSLNISSKSLKIMSYGFCLGESDSFPRVGSVLIIHTQLKMSTSEVRSRLSISKPHALNQWFSNFSTH